MTATLLAGLADHNASLYRRLQVPLGDPAAWIEIDEQRIALVRDLEMDRVRQHRGADQVTSPAEHAPPSGLSADRETATAQAVAQLLCDYGIEQVRTDRSLPYIYAWHLGRRGVSLEYDPELGVLDRRQKSEEEIARLTDAQHVTEQVMRLICETIARASVGDDGTLIHEGHVLTSETVRQLAAVEFLHRGFSMRHGAIVATAPQVADCHHPGNGPLKTGLPIVIDLFPRDESSRYWGDCTRTVVHGTPTATVRKMQAAVTEAKAAAIASLSPGTTADAVHRAAEEVLLAHGFAESRGRVTDEPTIQHGTGHGIGLELHEPILLDRGGGEILRGEVFTVEPGLYGRADGGVRIEDMVVVADEGPVNLNRLPETLTWD